MNRKLTLLAAALAVGLIAAGCGGDDSDDSSSTQETGTDAAAAISKQDFLAQGNEICTQGNKEIDAAFSGIQGQPTEEQLTQITEDTVVPSIQGQVDGLRALGAPEGDEDQVNAILDAAQSALDDVEADPSLLASPDTPDPFEDANLLANDYGLTECGA